MPTPAYAIGYSAADLYGDQRERERVTAASSTARFGGNGTGDGNGTDGNGNRSGGDDIIELGGHGGDQA